MDLANCKLIESCNKYESIKKRIYLKNLDSRTFVIKSHSASKSPTASFTPSPKKSHPIIKKESTSVTNIQKNHFIFDISCKKYKIPIFSRKEIIQKNNSKYNSNRFITEKSAESSLKYYFHPRITVNISAKSVHSHTNYRRYYQNDDL